MTFKIQKNPKKIIQNWLFYYCKSPLNLSRWSRIKRNSNRWSNSIGHRQSVLSFERTRHFSQFSDTIVGHRPISPTTDSPYNVKPANSTICRQPSGILINWRTPPEFGLRPDTGPLTINDFSCPFETLRQILSTLNHRFIGHCRFFLHVWNTSPNPTDARSPTHRPSMIFIGNWNTSMDLANARPLAIDG